MHNQPERVIWTQCALLLTLVTAPISSAHAKEFRFGDLVLTHPRAFASREAPGEMIGVLGIRTNQLAGDTLTAVSVDSSVASTAVIQRVVVHDGVRTVVPVARLKIEPGDALQLSPEHVRLAFLGLKKRLEPGSTIEVELTFKTTGAVVAPFEVESLAPTRRARGADTR